MTRTPEEQESFDLLILGGGIVGACLAWVAAHRGLSVALVERGQLGGATSANSLRIVHGGLRHLQRLDFRRCRKYATEQRAWLGERPEMFRPLRCVVALDPGFSLKHLPYAAGFFLYNLLSWDRNRGLASSVRLRPAGFDKDWRPYWYDAQVVNPTGLVAHMAREAQSLGARLFLGHEAQKLNIERGRVVGVECLDSESKRSTHLTSRVTATALGPWTDQMLRNSDFPPLGVPWMQGINVSFDFQLSDDALVLCDRGGKKYFVTPSQSGCMIGTGQYPLPCRAGDWTPDQLDPEWFLSQLDALHPSLKGCRDRVVGIHRGLIPASKPGGVMPRQEDLLRDWSQDRGLICLVASKYSSARWLAERAVSICSSRKQAWN